MTSPGKIYYRGIDNFFNLYKGIVDSWMLVDNSVSPRELIAYGGRGKEEVILNKSKFIKVKTKCRAKN